MKNIQQLLNGNLKEWYQTHQNTAALLRSVTASLDVNKLSGNEIWQLMRLTWITHNAEGVSPNHWQTLKVPALASLFGKRFDIRDDLATTILAMGLPAKVESAALLKTGAVDFRGVWRNVARQWCTENRNGLRGIILTAKRRRMSQEERIALAARIEKLPDIPSPNDKAQARAVVAVSPIVAFLDPQRRFPIINGRPEVAGLLARLGLTNRGLGDQVRHLTGLIGQFGIEDSFPLDIFAKEIGDLAKKVRQTEPRKTERKNEKQLPDYDVDERLATQKTNTVVYRNRHNKMTEALKQLFEGYERVWLSCWTNLRKSDRTSCRRLSKTRSDAMPKMVIEVPDQFVEVGKAMAEHLAMLQRTVDRLGGGKAVDYAAVEAAIAEGASRTELAAHGAILKSLDIDVPAVVIGGVRYTRVGRCEGAYHTMVGSVSVERSLYRQSGERGGQPGGRVVDAVSLRAGVVGDGWLPQTARAMSFAVQQGTSREAEKTAQEFKRLPYSRASFERVAHVVGALAVADHQDIEDALIDALEVPAEAYSVSVSLDRVSVPMEEPRPRPVGRPQKGAAKRPVERNFRMAYCGTVTLHDKTGVGRYTIRYGCMPEGDIVGLRDRMVADVATLRSKRPDLKIELLCDGAPEMWNLLEDGFRPKFGNDLECFVDFYHTTEKLSAAAHALEDSAAAAGERLGGWKQALLHRSRAAADILRELVVSGRDEGVGTDHPVHEAITYLQNHGCETDRMNYARARRLGLALGTGNVEATCKSLFEMRMKRCGARWKPDTGQHIVQLRAFALSDRWEPAIELTLRPLRMAVRAA